MADYIYLLENRLSAAQRAALRSVREVARVKGLTVFLVGGAVRDLTSGSPVRDLDVVLQGNALKVKKDIEKAGGSLSGENELELSLFVRFPGGVRMEIGSTLLAVFPKPGKMVVKPATVLEDLRRRDFTANAMALSLNEGSYGLLMDPLNGVADIENRELRLVSNYGFIEDPVRMIRAARYMARLGWTMEERTQARYETGKQEGYISAMSDFHRGYETEEIFHEEDPLRVIKRLEQEGWMKYLFPALSAAKVNVAELERLRDSQTQLQMQSIHPEAAAANFPLLTGKLSAKEVAALTDSFPRRGFVQEIAALEAESKEFLSQFTGKGASTPSQAWKLLHAAKPESVLWAAHTAKSANVQAKFKSFYVDWPQARQKLPYALLQEMRIVPGLAGYDDLLDQLFFELMDGKLGTIEEMKTYLEPFSPPAPPPPVHLRRPRAAKKEAKPVKSRKKAVAEPEETSPADSGESAPEIGPPNASSVPDVPTSRPVKVPAKKEVPSAAKKAAPAAEKKPAPIAKNRPALVVQKKIPVKTATKPAGRKVVVKTPAKKVIAKLPAKKVPAKPQAKVIVRPLAKKVVAKAVAKKAPAKIVSKKVVAKAAAKKASAKVPAKKAVVKKAIAKKAPAKTIAKKKR